MRRNRLSVRTASGLALTVTAFAAAAVGTPFTASASGFMHHHSRGDSGHRIESDTAASNTSLKHQRDNRNRRPDTPAPTTAAPTTAAPKPSPTTAAPTTSAPKPSPSTSAPKPSPSTAAPTTSAPTPSPSTSAPRPSPTTAAPTSAAPTTTAPAPAAPAGSRWIPAQGVDWQWQLTGTIDTSVNVPVYDVDAVDTSAATVAALHAAGRHVICYVDVGTYEPGRPDSASIPASVQGKGVDGWPGEKWLDVRAISTLAPILDARFKVCQDKGFDAVEPDNVDAYANPSGFPLTAADQLAFNRWVASAVHARGMSVLLKNDVDQVADLQPSFDFALNEQCFQYSECDTEMPFINAGKAVLEAEYSKTPAQFCPSTLPLGFSPIQKKLDLDAWRATC